MPLSSRRLSPGHGSPSRLDLLDCPANPEPGNEHEGGAGETDETSDNENPRPINEDNHEHERDHAHRPPCKDQPHAVQKDSTGGWQRLWRLRQSQSEPEAQAHPLRMRGHVMKSCIWSIDPLKKRTLLPQHRPGSPWSRTSRTNRRRGTRTQRLRGGTTWRWTSAGTRPPGTGHRLSPRSRRSSRVALPC
jgi:hypothetical protein